MKIVTLFAFIAFYLTAAHAAPETDFSVPEACQTYTDGDLEQALSCVNAVNQIEKDRIQYDEDRTYAIYSGVGLGAGFGAIGGMVVGGMKEGTAGMSWAGLRELGFNVGKGGAVGAGIGAIIGGGIAIILYPTATGAGAPPIDVDTVEGFNLFFDMEYMAQIAFLNDYNPTNLINFLFAAAKSVRDSEIQDPI